MVRESLRWSVDYPFAADDLVDPADEIVDAVEGRDVVAGAPQMSRVQADAEAVHRQALRRRRGDDVGQVLDRRADAVAGARRVLEHEHGIR